MRGVAVIWGDAEHCEKMSMLMRAKYIENSCIVKNSLGTLGLG